MQTLCARETESGSSRNLAAFTTSRRSQRFEEPRMDRKVHLDAVEADCCGAFTDTDEHSLEAHKGSEQEVAVHVRNISDADSIAR